jgi:ADP-ribosylglycohydrolase
MPVHWYYNPADIFRQFPGGIQGFEAAPANHPSSIMSLHSTAQGGRRSGRQTSRDIVGEVILKGRRKYWGDSRLHYHHGMQAGQNTLNAHCARVLMRSLAGCKGHYYDPAPFLQAYIDYMTADPPRHPDTYAESYHRGFFANLEAGRPADQCGAVTHDTASIGGLVTIAPLVFAERLSGTGVADIQEIAHRHLMLTHPDQALGEVCGSYVALLCDLLACETRDQARGIIAACARDSARLDLPRLLDRNRSDFEIVGGLFSSACYISGSWPSVLYLAYRYLGDSRAALLNNANLGGDNVHRGFVLGTILGLTEWESTATLFGQLQDCRELHSEINALLPACGLPSDAVPPVN